MKIRSGEKAGVSSALEAPFHLRCEYIKNPLGIDTSCPRLSWRLRSEQRDQVQAAYRVLVASSQELLERNTGDLWDSGRVKTSDSVNVEYLGKRLNSGQICFWKVQAWDGAGLPTPYSQIATFEMGLLDSSDWQGVWIQADESISAPLFRKEFSLAPKPVKRARAYVCGLGYFEIEINGQKVGSDVLVPQWTNYDHRELRDLIYPWCDHSHQRVLYLTYDVTNSVGAGMNAIGLILGNGWYNQRERNAEGKMWYGAPRLILQLNIEYADATTQSITTDTDWSTSPSPIAFNNIYFGEKYDARKEQLGWSTPGFDDSGWAMAQAAKAPSGVLRAQTAPSDRVVQTMVPVRVQQVQPGVYVYDLGQNISGWAKIRLKGQRGTKVTLRFAEEVTDKGMLDFTSCGGERQIQLDEYILKGHSIEQWEPRFTWHGRNRAWTTTCSETAGWSRRWLRPARRHPWTTS